MLYPATQSLGLLSSRSASHRLALLIRHTVLAFALVLSPQGFMDAQVANGTISVNVTDSTEASIPGASVTVTNTETGLTRTGSTDVRGVVRFPALPVGAYSVVVESTGFKQLTIGSVVLQVGQTAAVPVSLEIGQISGSLRSQR
jgi:hypothetical protein